MVNAGKNPPSLSLAQSCLCSLFPSHIVIKYGERPSLWWFFTIQKCCNHYRSTEGAKAGTCSVAKYWEVIKELQLHSFSFGFWSLMLHTNLENTNLQGSKNNLRTKKILSVISSEALQHYVEGPDHKIFLNLWGRIIPFKMCDKIVPQLHLDSRPANSEAFLGLSP